jgi:hypothetical protein
MKELSKNVDALTPALFISVSVIKAAVTIASTTDWYFYGLAMNIRCQKSARNRFGGIDRRAGRERCDCKGAHDMEFF